MHHSPSTTVGPAPRDSACATIEHSSSIIQAKQRMLAEVADWIACCRRDLAGVLPIDNHDQGTFTTAWEPYIRHTGDRDALAFMKQLRDDVSSFYTQRDQWHHGYWRMQEAHHGTEHFELFLGALWRLDPTDAATASQLIDAAEHLGNWVPSIPPWFDWDTGLFRSLWFGTDGIQPPDGPCLNYPDHLRCVNIALLAWEMTQQRRYLDLATAHAGRWADYLATGQIPSAISASDATYSDTAADVAYRNVAGQGAVRYTPVNAAEQFLASGVIGSMLTLHRLTGQPRFLEAGQTLLAALAPELRDPDAGVVAAALLDYRQATGDPRFDPDILRAAAGASPATFPQLTLSRSQGTTTSRPDGVGKRADKPHWTVAGQPLPYHPIVLAAAACISQDSSLATLALDLGRTQLQLARHLYPHGHTHGCSAQSVSAIARGHGRENNAGILTAVMAPIFAHFPDPA